MIVRRLEVNRRRVCMLVHVCETDFERTRGLLFRRRLPADEAWLIPGCHAVHTIGLGYPIDIAFCTHDGTVLRVVPALAPWRMASAPNASEVWEFAPGGLERLDLRPGDRLCAH